MALSKLVYIGNVSASYDLATIIKAVEGLEGVELHIAGTTDPARTCLESGYSCPRYHFHGYLSAAELEKLLAECDLGLIPMFPASCVGIPYKLADYAKAGLKIVESLGGETGELVAKFGVGTHYEAGNIDSCRAAITAALNLQVPPAQTAAFASQFDASTIYPAYVRWATAI